MSSEQWAFVYVCMFEDSTEHHDVIYPTRFQLFVFYPTLTPAEQLVQADALHSAPG